MFKQGKIKRAAALPIILSLLLTACSTGKPVATEGAKPDDNGKKNVEITMWVGESSPGKEMIQKAVDMFMQKNPNIKVKMEQPATFADAATKLSTALNTQSAADVIQLAMPLTYGFAQRGDLLDLTDRINAWGVKDDFLKAAYDMGVYDDGKVYAVPWQVDTYGVVYRKDWFDEKGIAAPKTEGELLAAAKALTDPSKKRYGVGFAGGDNFYNLSIGFWANGTDVIKKQPDGKWKAAFNNEDGKRVLKYYYDMINTDKVASKSIVSMAKFTDVSQGFGIGEYAMTFMNPFMIKDVLKNDPSIKVGVTNFPTGKAGTASKLGGRSLVIPKATKYPDEAWELVKYLNSEEPYAAVLKDLDVFSTRKSIQQTVKADPLMQGFIDMMDKAQTYPKLAEYGAVQKIVNAGFQEYLFKGDLDAAANDMEKKINDLFK